MRAALLPAGSDPFLLAYWLRNYRTWAEYVDELSIVVCGQENQAVQRYLTALAQRSPHTLLRFAPRTDHGQVIGELIEESTADIVMLCEDDAFVRKPEKVDEVFRRIEAGETDIVGCPRATGSDGILNLARQRFGDWRVSSGESGPLLWPCFLFAKRDDLLRTDQRFGAWGWAAGESVMDETFPGDEAMDTFGWATLQLRKMGLRIQVEPNYRAQLACLQWWADSGAPWFHVGGLSVGYGLYLSKLSEELKQVIRDDAYDWAKRISWWLRVADKWDGALPEEHDAYLEQVHKMTSIVDADGIMWWKRGFDALISWTE